MNTCHDSRPDTLAHIARVAELLTQVAARLLWRAAVHDKSKLEEPERSAFDRLKAAELSGMDYLSDAYKTCLAKEEAALRHHYAHNSHHPEHHPQGVAGMSLLDLLEMLIDWKAATERMRAKGDIWRSLAQNRGRFKIEPQLQLILENTARELGWKREDEGSHNPCHGWPLNASHPPEELVRLRGAGVTELIRRGYSETEKFTCDTCRFAGRCCVAFDAYNVDGDCLADR